MASFHSFGGKRINENATSKEDRLLEQLDRKIIQDRTAQRTGNYGRIDEGDLKSLNGYMKRTSGKLGCASCKECDTDNNCGIKTSFCKRFKFNTDNKHTCLRHTTK